MRFDPLRPLLEAPPGGPSKRPPVDPVVLITWIAILAVALVDAVLLVRAVAG